VLPPATAVAALAPWDRSSDRWGVALLPRLDGALRRRETDAARDQPPLEEPFPTAPPVALVGPRAWRTSCAALRDGARFHPGFFAEPPHSTCRSFATATKRCTPRCSAAVRLETTIVAAQMSPGTRIRCPEPELKHLEPSWFQYQN